MIRKLMPAVLLVAVCWVVFGVNNLALGGRLTQHGIVPRDPQSLPGILWSPFLHGSFEHLAANTLPLLILGAVLCARSRVEFALVTVAGILLGGGLTWLVARQASHIGASGLIFCYFGYLASLAFFRRTLGTLVISAVCLIAYGGIIKGVLPTTRTISWEGHAAGLAAGIVLGWMGAMLSPKPKPEEGKAP